MDSEGRVVNFFPGPSGLPEEVLHQASKEMLNYRKVGYGVMEMSHRSAEFVNICREAEKDLRTLMNIPNNYKVLFLQGGCSGMFSAVPLNFLSVNGTADYIVTGTWSEKAAKEAQKYGNVNLVVPKPKKYLGVPSVDQWNLSNDADYVYYCSNETVGGVEFQFIPEVNGKSLICDMSSNIMTREIDVSKFACIVGGAQKLLGPAGVTLAIVRDDMLGKERKECPSIWNFKTQAEQESRLNTPPCYSIYITGLVFKWMLKSGGVSFFEKRNIEKSKLLYETMENSKSFYVAVINKDSQSRVNIPFLVGGPNGNEALEKEFAQEAKKQGLDGLSGHRSVGGCRASIYNVITLEDVRKLCAFMEEFQSQHQN